jgi:hypothetical protein
LSPEWFRLKAVSAQQSFMNKIAKIAKIEECVNDAFAISAIPAILAGIAIFCSC